MIRKRLLLGGLVIGIWLISTWLAAVELMVSDELNYADAIVVLAGSSTYVERAHEAALLFRQGRAPRVIVTNDNEFSGWSNERERNPFFFERTIDVLTQDGVASSRIEVLPRPVKSTYDEATAVRDYAESARLSSILVVTSVYHARRALLTWRSVFRSSGIRIGLTTALAQTSPSPFTWWLKPLGWRLVAEEYVKLVYYKVHYRI